MTVVARLLFQYSGVGSWGYLDIRLGRLTLQEELDYRDSDIGALDRKLEGKQPLCAGHGGVLGLLVRVKQGDFKVVKGERR
ncbi:MAG: hypothetical protein M3Q29_12780 [Chloroflexota bacterium]|nr:hypothetical protein [Chloroflexota bacterium]